MVEVAGLLQKRVLLQCGCLADFACLAELLGFYIVHQIFEGVGLFGRHHRKFVSSSGIDVERLIQSCHHKLDARRVRGVADVISRHVAVARKEVVDGRTQNADALACQQVEKQEELYHSA